MQKFLDLNGLSHFWNKVKSYVDSHSCSSVGGAQGDSPTGTIISWLGSSAPNGYLVCDGTTYNVATYIALADFIEAEFGAKNHFGGDGANSFAVPDLRGRFLLGKSDSHAMGETGGSEEVTLTVDQMPQHRHTYQKVLRSNTSVQSGSTSYGTFDSIVGASTETAGGNTSHPNMPPYFTVNYCIKY